MDLKKDPSAVLYVRGIALANKNFLIKEAQFYINEQLLYIEKDNLKATKKGTSENQSDSEDITAPSSSRPSILDEKPP